MPARVLVVGLDACDATLIERWSASGDLPGFSALAQRGRVYHLDNCLETLPGAIWPEITTGRSCGKMAQFCHPMQLHTGESRLRPIESSEIDPEQYYWTVASRHGCRVAVIDQVQAVQAPGLNGIQLYEWGLHDRTIAICSDPPTLINDIRTRYGDHPVADCELHGTTAAGYARLLAGLETGMAKKLAFAQELMHREAWGLFACTFSESHCVGHQFWHFQDPAYPRYDRDAPAAFRDAMRTVYAALDHAMTELVKLAGSAAQVIVVASHGMGMKFLGPQLLPELLVRLGLSSGGSGQAARVVRRLLDPARMLPLSVKLALKRLARRTSVDGALAQAGVQLDPFESPRTRAAAVPNNRCGAIRLNLKGREPRGSVTPGEEAQVLIDLLRREILALRHVASGKPIVERVVTADEAFGADRHPDIPDLIVVFRTDVGRLDTCVSPSVGEIRVSSYYRHCPRTGDHTPESRMWIAGPGIRAVREAGRGNVLDLAPTVLSMLNVPLPGWLDGKPLPLR